MKIYRCLCTKNKESGEIFVDFAFTPERDPQKVTFEPSTENELSHMDLFKLRQKQNTSLEQYLPPLFLYDDKGKLSVLGAKRLSQKNVALLKKFSPTIKASYQKFIHQYPGKKSTLSGHIIDEKDLRLKGQVNSPQAARRLAEAQQEKYNRAKMNGTFDALFINLPPER